MTEFKEYLISQGVELSESDHEAIEKTFPFDFDRELTEETSYYGRLEDKIVRLDKMLMGDAYLGHEGCVYYDLNEFIYQDYEGNHVVIPTEFIDPSKFDKAVEDFKKELIEAEKEHNDFCYGCSGSTGNHVAL